MSRAVLADTHALVWFLFEPARLSTAARQAMEHAASDGGLVISSVSLVELTYLTEKGRLPAEVLLRVTALAETSAGLRVEPLDIGVARALAAVPRSEVPDLPDRVVAATALHLGIPVVSRDRKIAASSIRTIW